MNREARRTTATAAAIIAAAIAFPVIVYAFDQPQGSQRAAAAIAHDFRHEGVQRVSCPDVVRDVIPCTVTLRSGRPMPVWYDTRDGSRGFGNALARP